MKSGLCKYDHVSHHRLVIGYLPVRSVIQHRSLVAMHKQCRSDHCLLWDLPIELGHQSSYYTRTPASFANIFRYHLSFSKKFFDHRPQTGGMICQ